MSNWSNITFPEDVYRWLIANDILLNKGQVNEKSQAFIPFEDGLKFQNGYNVSQIIKIILYKNGESPSDNLKNIISENSKQTKSTNWSFIWLSFQDLRLHFDNRIKQLILNGENALISEIVKQLYDKDDHKNQSEMKKIIINRRVVQKKAQKQNPMNGSKKDAQKLKQKQPQNGVVDIKKLNLSKNPDESQSSLQFLILLLTQSLHMTVQQVLGLFTNQNKYLAHLIVKGVNQQYQGIKLFYTLLNKHYKKMKQFVQSDPKDAHSCLYAVKPGFISKDENVAELTIQLFLKMGNIYDWFVSDIGKGSNTLFLGIKRHPHFLDLLFDLLMNIIQNQQADYFTNYFKASFRDSHEMIESCSFVLSSLANSFFKEKLFELGILDQWIEIALKLFEQNIQNKIVSYKFMGEVMSCLPMIIQNNEQYLSIFRNNWHQRKMIDFILLTDEIMLIFQKLASEKNEMAKKLYQIIIQIADAVYDQFDKREYLFSQFLQILPQFPSIPINFIVQIFKQSKLKNYQVDLITSTVNLSSDPNCLMKVAQQALKYYLNDSLVHYYLANTIFKTCQKTIDSDQGKSLILKAIKGCLQAYANAQITKKNPKIVKQQPMYGIVKGNSERVSQKDTHQYNFKQKMQANLISLVDKLCELVIENVNQELQKSIKSQLLQSNSFIKKNHFKMGSKHISQILNKRFAVNKQEELDHDQDYNNRKSLDILDESNINRKATQIKSQSRYSPGPHTLTKQFAEVIEKKKQEEEEKRFQEEKKSREQAYKKTLVKKQLEKVNLLRGFAQEAQIKEDGFWQKFKKEEGKQLQLYPPDLMQPKDVQMIQNMLKKYHRLLRYLFLKYTASMYTTRQSQNFNECKERKQTISVVELIKFLKDYKLYFLTNSNEVQNLVRDINVKIINKRQTQQLDFMGFQQFLIQFCSIIYTKPHTITAKSLKGEQNIRKKLIHLSHSEIIAEWFDYLRTVFIEKGEKTAIFDQPEAAYFNQTEVIKEFNKKIQENPDFILPEGYKKITEKVLVPEPKVTNNISKLPENYIDVMEILDEILYENIGFHILESITKKDTKIRVKPHAFVNVQAKLLDATSTKPRVLSSIIQKKTPAIPPVKMLEKKTLSFGMRLGLSYIGYRDKLLGEQVAFVIDDMLDAIQKGRSTIQKQKIINQVVKNRMQKQEQKQKEQQDKKRKLKQRKSELQRMKKQNEQKKQKHLQDTKEERQKQQKKKQQKQKRIKQRDEKYVEQQQQKIKEKKEKESQENKKKDQEVKKKKEDKKKTKEQFENFNKKEIEKFQSKLKTEGEKKKQGEQKQKEDEKKKEQTYKKLRQKIVAKDKKAIEIKQKTNQQILQLYNSPNIKAVLTQFQPATKALFDFLMQSTFISLTQKKPKNQVILQTWHYFNLVFQLSPLIISAKEIVSIFRTLTKDKHVTNDYFTGLSYEQFKQALLRITILHKSVFNKIADKIKEDDMTDKQINDIINKDIEEKQKNEFDEPNQIDVKSLLKEEDIKKQYFNHYGDVSKVNQHTLKGLIYYLKVPRDKQGQEARWRQIIASQIKYSSTQTQQLKQKLNQEYSIKKQQRQRQKQRIRKRLAASQNLSNSMMNSSIMKESKMENSLEEKEQAENKDPQT